MSKELEALERIKREAGIPYFSSLYDIDMWREDFKTIETALKENEELKISYLENLLNEQSKEYIYKELKALEIIKGGRIQFDFYPNDYVIHIILKDKTKANLLKEVLL